MAVETWASVRYWVTFKASMAPATTELTSACAKVSAFE